MIWWLAFEKKPFRFWREIWIQIQQIQLSIMIPNFWQILISLFLETQNYFSPCQFQVKIYLILYNLKWYSTTRVMLLCTYFILICTYKKKPEISHQIKKEKVKNKENSLKSIKVYESRWKPNACSKIRKTVWKASK